MGNGHRVAHDLAYADLLIEDPGSGKRIAVDRNPAAICFESAGIETRYLDNPSRAGIFATLTCPENSVYMAFNSDVDAVTLNAGTTLVMQSIVCGTGYEWLTLLTLAGDGGGGGGGSSNRDNGEDDLGTLTLATEIDFDEDDYDNKKVTLGAASIEITLTSTRSKRYGLTVVQDGTGGRVIDFANATFLGSETQPAAGASAASHYTVFKSGSNYFVSRLA